jgi:hypothetical protein
MEEKENPITLLDVIIIAGPLVMLIVIALVGYFVRGFGL